MNANGREWTLWTGMDANAEEGKVRRGLRFGTRGLERLVCISFARRTTLAKA